MIVLSPLRRSARRYLSQRDRFHLAFRPAHRSRDRARFLIRCL